MISPLAYSAVRGRTRIPGTVQGKEIYSAPSYSDICGSGDRTGYIALMTNFSYAGWIYEIINGNYNNNVYFQNQGAGGLVFAFHFPGKQLITEATWYQDNWSTHGTWKWQGSNATGVWTDIGAEFTLGGAPQTQTTLSANNKGYSVYRLLGVSGNTSNSPYIREVEFKIGHILYD